jgi:hypothetical protein
MKSAKQWVCDWSNGRDDIHIYPKDDFMPHRVSGDCWCQPRMDTKERALTIHDKRKDTMI